MALRIALLLAMPVAVRAQGATCEEDEAGLLQKTSVESLKVAKANSSVGCICNPDCEPLNCGCTYTDPPTQYCDVNGAEVPCPRSELCKDASGPTPSPTPSCAAVDERCGVISPGEHWVTCCGDSLCMQQGDMSYVWVCKPYSPAPTPSPTPAAAPWSVVLVGGETNLWCVVKRNLYQDAGEGALETFVSGVCHTVFAGSAISTCSDDGKILNQQFFMNPNCEGQPQTDFVLTQNHCSEDASGMHYAYFCRPASA
jgi:hypothetical protein